MAGNKEGWRGSQGEKRDGQTQRKGGEREEEMGGLRIYILKQIRQKKETTVSLRRAGTGSADQL